ncbi:MAG: hypothetical protein ACTS73_02620 [Arsenophonus sp. NEOnobi-MAG3]
MPAVLFNISPASSLLMKSDENLANKTSRVLLAALLRISGSQKSSVARS